MAPPSFVELGKLCRDLLTKGYLDGYWRLDCRTMTSPGVHFSTSAQATSENKIIGFIESKCRVPDTNVFLTARWHTDNLFFGEVALIDQFTEGLKLALQGNFNASSEEKSGLFVLGYGQPSFKIDADTTLDSSAVVNLSGVIGHEGFLGGYRGVFDSSSNEFKKHDFALGYVGGDFVLHLGINDSGKSYLGSLFVRANSSTDVGIEALYGEGEGDEGAQKVTVGTRCRLNSDSLVRAKIDQEANLSLGYQRVLREGVSAYFSCMLVCKDLKDGAHKVGVGLEIEI